MPILQWDRLIIYQVYQLLTNISTNIHKMKVGNLQPYINSK